MASSSAMETAVFTASRDRIAALADMRRAAGLSDIRLEVSVAHTNQRLRARFCVRLWRSTHPRGAWAFGMEIKEATQFARELRHQAKKIHRGGTHCKCPLCGELRHEFQRWRALFPAFSSLGKRHGDAKCRMLTQFFYRVFAVLAQHAPWLQSCELLRELLRRTETLCRIANTDNDDDDRAAARVLASLVRVTPVIRSHLLKYTSVAFRNGESDCSICLGRLVEPTETSLNLTKPTTSTISTRTLQPTQGVELTCGHRFHDACISLWFHTRLNCPVCRQTANPSES